MSLGWVAHLRGIEDQARATCERHGETLEAALKKYDTYRQALKDDTDLLMQYHTLLWHPIQLVSRSLGEKRKQNEMLIAAALHRHMEEARQLLGRQAAGSSLFQVGVIAGELYLALRIRELESDRGRLMREMQQDEKDAKLQPMLDFIILRQREESLKDMSGPKTMKIRKAAEARRNDVIDQIRKHNDLGIVVTEVPAVDWIKDAIEPFVPDYAKKSGRPPRVK